MKKINATGNPGCILFNSEWAISAGNTLRIGADGEHGACVPNPSPAGSWELPKSEEKKLEMGWGTGSSWPNKLR